MQTLSFIKRIGRWINRTVQRKLIVWSVGFWLLSIATVVLVFLLVGQNQMLTVARQRNIQLASTVSRDVNTQLSSITGDTRAFTEHLAALNPNVYTQADALLGLRLSSARYKAIYYFDMDGVLLVHLMDTIQSLLPVLNPAEIVDRPPIAVRNEIADVFTSAKETGIYISDVYYTPMDFIPVIYIGRQVIFLSTETRIVVFEVDISDVWQTIAIASVGQTGFTYVVSRDGIVITHPEPTYVGHQIPVEIKPVLASYEGSAQLVDPFSGKEVVVAYSPVGGLLEWGIVVSQDRDEIYANVMKSTTIILVILLALGFTGTAGILFLIRNVTRPIKELTKTTQSIANTGNLVKTGLLQRPDEVGQLSQAFDQMVDKVKDTEEKLTSSEERYRSLFEHANDAILLIGESAIFDCNRKAEEIFGANRDQIIGKSPSDLSPASQPDGISSKEKEQRLISRTFMGESQFFEWRHRRLNGELFDAEVRLDRLNIDNEQILMAIVRDITERRKAAERLQESEQLFRSIVENSQAGIFTVDNAFHFTYVNDRLCQILDYSRHEIIGRDFRDFLDEESKLLVAERYLRRQQGQEVPSWYEFRVIQKSGLLRNVELSASVVRDARGNVTTVGQVLDITERKKNERALRQSEEHYRTLFNSTNDAIFIHDLQGKFLDVNSVVCDRLGYSHDELMQMKVTDIDTPEFADLVPDRIIELREKGHFVAETAHLSRDKRIIPTEISSRVIQYYGVPAILTIARDITERKKAQTDLLQAHNELESRVEQRTADLREANLLLNQEIAQRKETEEKLRQSESKYRDLVESANSIILEFDLNGNITFFNRFAQDFFGYEEEEILGKNILGTIVPEIDSAGVDLKVKMADLVKHPEWYISSENENMRSNGERVWVAWTNKGIYDERGNLCNILSIGIDRTEQKRTAEMLAKQERENVAAAERTRLARDLHDAVSQTLFSASIISDVLPRLWERDQDMARQRLQEVRELTRGALAEMRTLLFELRPAALADAELGDLLRQLAESITGRAKVSVSMSVEGQCSLSAETKIGLYRIAQEALNNIAKHSNASNATVILRCQAGQAELRIKDNGKGFDISSIPVESLGLGIMRERARAIGALLDISSNINEGTEITITWRDFRKEND